MTMATCLGVVTLGLSRPPRFDGACAVLSAGLCSMGPWLSEGGEPYRMCASSVGCAPCCARAQSPESNSLRWGFCTQTVSVSLACQGGLLTSNTLALQILQARSQSLGDQMCYLQWPLV